MNIKTPTEILAMTDQERRDYHNLLANKVMKKFVIMTAVKIVTVVAVVIIANRIGDRLPEEDEDQN